MTQQEAASSPDIISDRLTILGKSAYALIDPGATHSFIAYIICIMYTRRKKYDEPGFNYRYASG